MSNEFLESLRAQVKTLTEAHEKNRFAYRAAKEERAAMDLRVRALCDVASESANQLGAARKALEEYERNAPPKREVRAEGAVGAAGARAENGEAVTITRADVGEVSGADLAGGES